LKRLNLIIVALLCANLLFGQFPPLETYSISGLSSVSFKGKKSGSQSKYKTEVPPWIIPGRDKSYFFVDGSDTYVWTSPIPLTVDWTINLKKQADGPFLASRSYINSPEYNAAQPAKDWGRVYHAIYSANAFNHPSTGPVTIGFLHGENKNYVSGSKHYQNTIQANIPINPADHQTYSGGSPYIEGWEAYNALISASWISNNAQTNGGKQFFSNELGPIVWPATGYITSGGVKATSGLKHPSSIIAGNYIYVYYSEGGPYAGRVPDEHGRMEGIKVAKAPLQDALNANSYQVYYKDANGVEGWERSLPEGFTKEKMLDFVAVKGGRASDIMNDEQHQSQHIRFAAAKVRNSNYFIGVEEYIDLADARKFKVAIRFSADLVHWTNRSLVVIEAPDWESSRLNYPVFVDKDGSTNTEVDIDDFYILGTDPGVKDHVNKLHFIAPATKPFAVDGRTRMQEIPMVIMPNPNNGLFKLAYELNATAAVAINVYNLKGQQVQAVHGQLLPGKYVQDFDIRPHPPGVYLVCLLVNDKQFVYKVMKGY
jgi:hypothetical protein